MSSLYKSLAEVYEAMYKTFINYEEEFSLYQQLLVKNNVNDVIEIGCGTGNLASRFVADGFTYTGLDNSADMLVLAKKNNPHCKFLHGTMLDFVLDKPVKSAIVTGRTISYLLTNKDVFDCLTAIHKNLLPQGILCFDFIDANKFIPKINSNAVVHNAMCDGKNFIRESFWKLNPCQSWAFDWTSVFYKECDDGSLVNIGKDDATTRAFTKDEIILFLQLAGYTVKEIFPRITYAFDTFVVVAEKINSKPIALRW